MPIYLKYNNNLDLSSIPLELRLILSCLRASAGQEVKLSGTSLNNQITPEVYIFDYLRMSPFLENTKPNFQP